MVPKVCLLMLAAVLVAALAPGVRVERARAAGPFVVNSTGDAADAVPGDGVCETATAGECTLRAAIQESNAVGGGTINFAIASGAQTIAPASALPDITAPVVIDGTTQPGWSGLPLINLDGSGAGAVSGLRVAAGGSTSTIRGLAIYHFGSSGIYVDTANHVTIDGNTIGTDTASTAGIGNGWSGIFLYNAGQNTIGGPLGNVISGNGQDGLDIYGQTPYVVSLNVVQNNRIGTNVAGTASLGNGYAGVLVWEGEHNTIGGLLPSERNIISGNQAGIRFARSLMGPGTPASYNYVRGNFIGTDITGTIPIGNSYGVDVSSGMNYIGEITGTPPVGPCTGACNVISGNGIGVFVHGAATGAQIVGNAIGVGADGTRPIPSGTGIVLAGLIISAQWSYSSTVTSNTIAYNSGTGVSVDPSSNVVWNTIWGNSIRSNGALGIDLGNDGVTPNDPFDADTGANDLQNFPGVGLAYTQPGSLLLQGTLESTPSSPFTLNFYATPACDPSGHGEGEWYLGATSVATNASGKASYSTPLGVEVPTGDVITATATSSSGDTSEFSACHPVTNVAPACSGDTDCDGYTDSQEVALGTDPTTYCSIMRADVNGDGKANLLDLGAIATQFGQSIPPANPRYDQNGDGEVNLLDLGAAALVFGQSVSGCP